MMEQYLVTNLSQAEKHRLKMHMESDELHEHLYQILGQPYNGNAKEYYVFLLLQTFLHQLGA